MISKLSKKISLFLYRKEIIDIGELEIYKYGFEIICSTLIGFIITLLIGLMFQMFLLSMIYYFAFVLIRQFTGGYHAKSYFMCNLVFSIVTLFVFGFTKMAVFAGNYSISIHLLLLLLSILITWYYAPIENENKPLDEEQKKRNHWIGTIQVCAVSAVSCLIYKISEQTSILLAFTLLAIAMLIAITKLSEGGNKSEQD